MTEKIVLPLGAKLINELTLIARGEIETTVDGKTFKHNFECEVGKIEIAEEDNG